MSDTFMAAYERAEARNDIQHGYFQDKKEEREKERARKKRNQRIAGIAAVGAGLAAAGGLVAYQHSERGKAAAERRGAENAQKMADLDEKIKADHEAKAAKYRADNEARSARINKANEKIYSTVHKIGDRMKRDPAKESERKAETAARINSINQKVGAAATKVQDRIKEGQAKREARKAVSVAKESERESRRESSVFKSGKRASNSKDYAAKLDAALKERARRYEERERQWDREEMARLRKESDERLKKYGGDRYYR